MASTNLVEMYKDFLSLVRKSRVGTVGPTEFTQILNLAQEEVISQMLKVLDLNQKFMSGLLPLRTITDPLSLTAIIPLTSDRYNPYKVASGYPSDCRMISRVITLLEANLETKTNLVKSNEISNIVNGVYSKPTKNICYYQLEVYEVNNIRTESIKLFLPSINIVSPYPKCIIEYYKSPTAIPLADVIDNSKSCVFNKDICTDIINTAARMYLENIQDARYQTFNNELKHKQ